MYLTSVFCIQQIVVGCKLSSVESKFEGIKSLLSKFPITKYACVIYYYLYLLVPTL